MGSSIDYREGYDTGIKEKDQSIVAGMLSGLLGHITMKPVWINHLNDDFANGYRDGLNGREFVPPHD